MKINQEKELLNNWLAVTNVYTRINNELEGVLQEKNNLSLKEFYVLYLLSQTDDKKLRLQQLQEMIGLSQSAMSRLVGRLEAKSCGVLERHICEDDRRGIYTSLTAKGEEKLKSCLDIFYSSFTKEHLQDELQSLIKKL